MNLKNTSDSYGFISKNFHWILAILLLSNFFLGFIMVELERGPLKSSIYGFHKSTGILLLSLIILRLFWRSVNTTPIPVANNKILNRLAKSVHYFFYFIVLMITLSGWTYSTARVGAVEVFGLFYMPAIVGINDQVGRIAKEIHIYSVYLFIAFVILHVLASIYHHFFLKDRTLKRMWY